MGKKKRRKFELHAKKLKRKKKDEQESNCSMSKRKKELKMPTKTNLWLACRKRSKELMQKICPKVLRGKEQKSLMKMKEWKMKGKMKIVIGTTMKNITDKQLEKLQIKIFLIKKTIENVEVISKTRGLKRNEKQMIKIQKRNLVVRVVKSLLLAQRRNLVVINLLLPLVEIRILVEILEGEPKEISKIGQLKALNLNSECQSNRNRNISRNRTLNEKLNRFSQLIITKK